MTIESIPPEKRTPSLGLRSFPRAMFSVRFLTEAFKRDANFSALVSSRNNSTGISLFRRRIGGFRRSL